MRIIDCAACCMAAFILGACGSQPQPVVNQSTAANSSTAANANVPSTRTDSPVAAPAHANNSAPASSASGGEPVDTSKYDAEIARLQKQAGSKGGAASNSSALAKAYLSRAEALTSARQYRAALGDYRRTLKYAPGNQEAEQMASRITGILQSMGRDVPPEGAEPTPLPYKK